MKNCCKKVKNQHVLKGSMDYRVATISKSEMGISIQSLKKIGQI